MRGLSGNARRFVPFNGGLGASQLDWLHAELRMASRAQERVVVFSHVPLHARACDGTTMVWDYEAALDVIASASVAHKHKTTAHKKTDRQTSTNDKRRSCVVAVICGHDHQGGYHRDEHGVHHITLASPLNRGEHGDAYGVVRVHRARRTGNVSLELTTPHSLNDLIGVGEQALKLSRYRDDDGHSGASDKKIRSDGDSVSIIKTTHGQTLRFGFI